MRGLDGVVLVLVGRVDVVRGDAEAVEQLGAQPGERRVGAVARAGAGDLDDARDARLSGPAGVRSSTTRSAR